MIVRPTALPGVLCFEPAAFTDARGWFSETWRGERYAEHGLPPSMAQHNLAWSRARVLRGLHLQHPQSQGKLVQTLVGAVFDVAVDVRTGSPTFGRWVGEELSAQNRRQLWIPPGFAHGYCVLSQESLLSYLLTAPYRPEHELALRYDDPRLAIAWPVADPLVSAKDLAAPRLEDLPAGRLPAWPGGS